MNISGLPDSIVSLCEESLHCPSCGAEARIDGRACVSCLLLAGLGEEMDAGADDLAHLLDEVQVRDTDWRLGNYQILEEIGRGGMGVIYRARQRHSKRIVALKRVLSYHGDSRETMERFRREAEAAASLDHPNILPIYEVSESEGLPFFTMKYATGGSLQQAAPALSAEPRECVRLLAKITRAIAYAHREGILHRDLKPGNILLDARGEPMVSDFGLAKWIDANTDLTRSLTIFGTPGYIAPEQAHGPAAALTSAADVYSLGAILFDLLTGRPPFLGEHALAVIREAAEKPAPKLRTLLRSTDRDLETICGKCLEREPRARYRSASDLAEDLERWLEGRPIVARPVSPPVRLWRRARRNPVASGLIVGCLLVAAVAISRQVKNRQLAREVEHQLVAQHSLAVLPFLDLDSGSADFASAQAVGEELFRRRTGPMRVTSPARLPAKWTGTGNGDEVRETAQLSNSRAILTGTVRRVEGVLRLSLHLVREDGNEVLGGWSMEAKAADTNLPAQAATLTGSQIYGLLEAAPPEADKTKRDPAWSHDAAREYLKAGQALLDRRTIADMDRAVACFESAIRAEPRSVEARSYLAMACVGRNFLLADTKLVARAIEVAHEALALAPQDPTAHRGLCMLYLFTQDYERALEHALRALEAGDRSERAFGQIAYVWMRTGRPDKAITWFQLAKVSHNQPADYDALIGDCLSLLKDDERTAEAYDKAARFRPDLPEGWLGLVRLKLLQGKIEDARSLWRARAQEYTAFPVAKQLEAQIELFARNYPEAERLYQALAEADPDRTNIHPEGTIGYRSVLAFLEQQRSGKEMSETAREWIAQEISGLKAAPRSADSLYRLAAAEATAGNALAAIRNLRQSIDAGWLDERVLRQDPRFDQLSGQAGFRDLAALLAERVHQLNANIDQRNRERKQTDETMEK